MDELDAGNLFDVVCIQELKAQNEQIDLEAFAQAGYHVYTETAEKRDIVAWPFSASRSRIMWNMAGNQEFDKEGRVIRADYGDLMCSAYISPSNFPTGDVKAVGQICIS